jgi:hypothetical protein
MSVKINDKDLFINTIDNKTYEIIANGRKCCFLDITEYEFIRDGYGPFIVMKSEDGKIIEQPYNSFFNVFKKKPHNKKRFYIFKNSQYLNKNDNNSYKIIRFDNFIEKFNGISSKNLQKVYYDDQYEGDVIMKFEDKELIQPIKTFFNNFEEIKCQK